MVNTFQEIDFSHLCRWRLCLYFAKDTNFAVLFEGRNGILTVEISSEWLESFRYVRNLCFGAVTFTVAEPWTMNTKL